MKLFIALLGVCLIIPWNLTQAFASTSPSVEIEHRADNETAILTVPLGRSFYLAIRDNLTGKDNVLLCGKVPPIAPVPFLRFIAQVSVSVTKDNPHEFRYSFSDGMPSKDSSNVNNPLITNSGYLKGPLSDFSLTTNQIVPFGANPLKLNFLYKACNWKIEALGHPVTFDRTLVFLVADSDSYLMHLLPNSPLFIQQLEWDPSLRTGPENRISGVGDVSGSVATTRTTAFSAADTKRVIDVALQQLQFNTPDTSIPSPLLTRLISAIGTELSSKPIKTLYDYDVITNYSLNSKSNTFTDISPTVATGTRGVGSVGHGLSVMAATPQDHATFNGTCTMIADVTNRTGSPTSVFDVHDVNHDGAYWGTVTLRMVPSLKFTIEGEITMNGGAPFQCGASSWFLNPKDMDVFNVDVSKK